MYQLIQDTAKFEVHFWISMIFVFILITIFLYFKLNTEKRLSKFIFRSSFFKSFLFFILSTALLSFTLLKAPKLIDKNFHPKPVAVFEHCRSVYCDLPGEMYPDVRYKKACGGLDYYYDSYEAGNVFCVDEDYKTFFWFKNISSIFITLLIFVPLYLFFINTMYLISVRYHDFGESFDSYLKIIFVFLVLFSYVMTFTSDEGAALFSFGLPSAAIILIILLIALAKSFAKNGDPGENKYGPNPEEVLVSKV